MPTFGQNLRRLRKRAGYAKQKDFAEALEVEQGTVSDLERDRRGLPEGPTLVKLAKIAKCRVDELLEGVDPGYDEILRDHPRHLLHEQFASYGTRGGPDVPASVDTRVLSDEDAADVAAQLHALIEQLQHTARLAQHAGELVAALIRRQAPTPGDAPAWPDEGDRASGRPIDRTGTDEKGVK